MKGSLFAIADLHLAFGAPDKSMERFGTAWKDYQSRIAENWTQAVKGQDLVLIAGDISWAMKPERAEVDLKWIDRLSGTKLLIRGNHDYWWESPSRVKKILPPSCHIIQNDAFSWNGLSIGGARLWDSEEFSYNAFIEFTGEPPEKKSEAEFAEDRRLFERELLRLEMSLKALDQKCAHRVAMTHYPPIGPPGSEKSRAALLLEKYRVDICVFGHLHSVREGSLSWPEMGGVRYLLTSADYLHFHPLQIL